MIGERSLGWRGMVMILGVMTIWELGVRATSTPAYLLPAPSQVMTTIVDDVTGLIPAAGVTLAEALAGLAIGGGMGLVLAVVITFWVRLEQGVLSLALLAKSTPVIAIAPILTIWLGFGHGPKVIVVAILTFFPILINTLEGLRSVDPDLMAWLHSIDASRSEIFRTARFPTAMPQIFAALRISAPLALIGAVVAEWMGASEGLGRTMWLAYTNLDMPSLFAAVVILTILSAFVYRMVSLTEAKLVFWRVPAREHAG